MLRFFGQGNMMNVSICEINYWWIERRGAVMGIAGAVVSSMMLGIIPIIMIIGIKIIILGLVPLLILLLERKEDGMSQTIKNI